METFSTPVGSFRCFKNDQNFYIHLKHDRFWESDLIINKLMPYYKSASTILDIGAHIGSHSFIYGYFNKTAKIYAFEPQKEIYKLLVENMKERPNVKTFNTCVGDSVRTTYLSQYTHCGENLNEPICYGDGPTMNLGGVGIGEGGEQVAMISIDSLHLDSCDFIKMDVEGAEGIVVQGAKETIQKFRPVICFEYSPEFDTSSMAKTLGLNEMPNVKNELYAIGYENFVFLEGDNWLALP